MFLASSGESVAQWAPNPNVVSFSLSMELVTPFLLSVLGSCLSELEAHCLSELEALHLSELKAHHLSELEAHHSSELEACLSIHQELEAPPFF
jgi:hypothetical protein